MSGGARLEVEGLALRYPNREVLREVALQVAPGEILALLGPSGCGKSSLLRALAGLVPPGAGTVRVDGTPLNGPRADIALAFQHPALLPWLSVERNVAFGLDFARQPALSRATRRARTTAALRAVGLEHARHWRPAQLSGGMAQRAALARSLAREPRALLLDEPFGALDEVTRAGMQQLLVEIVRRTGATAVLVTHDIDEALRVADRVVLLGNGGRLAGEWRVAVPAPRDSQLDALGALRIPILQALHDAMQPAAARGDA
ncbi:ABC transporter ATP-binding protein [Burkholderia plantarii]|uniref:ABC transporter ATP-binding protein n=1 Tax=Burkholderia plantarii TaxID=41899 RepID=UPI0006D8D669|nr:ABC transporter ATP-binding protein [Burkholderia plantarii]ALK33468.1 nitrate/sulfonate/bicarbonate ABC transporter ATPase [Burkholderia plantarii]WLE62524.1 ABC transporter ATP-binding protein [Burkholderia plantarii]GLZ16639.1 ABC transporter ATP-binding protein [Burkholderia plantarii]